MHLLPARRLAVVLVEPQIAANTGAIGRTCVALGASLHLVGPLGFSLDDRRVKRAGLDYWPAVRLALHHQGVDAWARDELPKFERAAFLSTAARLGGKLALHDADLVVSDAHDDDDDDDDDDARGGLALVLGAETHGLSNLPPHVLDGSDETRFACHIPMAAAGDAAGVRSLNLSAAAAMAAWEALRQNLVDSSARA